jgi:hypothetical protein
LKKGDILTGWRQQDAAIAIVNVGGMNEGVQQQAQCIYENVTLTTWRAGCNYCKRSRTALGKHLKLNALVRSKVLFTAKTLDRETDIARLNCWSTARQRLGQPQSQGSSHFCVSPRFASCRERFAIPPDVSG